MAVSILPSLPPVIVARAWETYESEPQTCRAVESVLRDAKETAAVKHYWHAAGRPKSSLRLAQMLPFFAKLPPCLVGIEACGTSHHWGARAYLARS
jgi:hypothetical protein